MQKLNIKDMHILAESKGFKCISTIYINSQTKLRWKCSFQHEWWAHPNSIQQGKGCPACYANKKHTIKDMHILAESKGFKCISTTYINSKTKLQWKCFLKHKWWAIPNSIRQGKGCPKCAINNRKNTIKDMHILAESKGFKCISTTYKNVMTKLEWKCPLKHVWLATPSNIKQGTGCPMCAKIKYLSEEKCRFIIEQITRYKFSKNRKVLNNRQEIDGFNKELQIGFEYQGEQHYRIIKRFSEKEFKNMQRRDKRKKDKIRKLKKQGTIKDIIFIKYTQSTSDEKLENYIIKKLNKINPNLIKNTKINWNEFYQYLSPLNDIKERIKDKGGKLLSNTYVNAHTKVIVDCGMGHIFEITPNSIKQNHWCSRCYGNTKLDEEHMQNFANKNHGVFDSDVYTNNCTKSEWRCLKCGDKWKKSYAEMSQRKYFCKKCLRKNINNTNT